MSERTVTICSAESFAGWNLGWAYGPAPVIRNLLVVYQNEKYTCSTMAQVK